MPPPLPNLRPPLSLSSSMCDTRTHTHTHTHTHTRGRSTTTAIAIDVYASPAAEARYTCEPGMRRVAQLTLELPAGWRQRVANRTDYDVEVGRVGWVGGWVGGWR